MKFDPRLKVLILGVGLALAAINAGADGWGYATNGDSSSQEGWGATSIGAANNPRGLDPTAIPDANGLGPYRSPVAHTPTGALYNVPWDEPQGDDTLSGSIDITGQYTTGTQDSGLFNNYRDMSDGVYINHFSFSAAGKGNLYLDANGGNVGRKDQYYQANIGEYNDWKIHAFYDELPHVYESNARLIFTGVGTNYLSLVPALQFTGQSTGAVLAEGAGVAQPQSGATVPIVQSVVANTAESTLEQDRKKGGLRFDKVLNDNWSLYASYSLEKRTGAMPYGQDGGGFPGAFNLTVAPGTGVNASAGKPVQVPYPIDFSEHVLIAGTSWSDLHDAFNAAVHVSIFSDENKKVYFENPYLQPALNNNAHIMDFTTFPSNQEVDAKLDFKHVFDGLMHSAFNANLYYALQKQDDTLLPNLDTTGFGTGVGTGINYAYFNSLIGPNGLPTLAQSTADVHNNIWMLNLGWSIHPMDKLSLKAGWRWYDQINSNGYSSFNPSCASSPVACGIPATAPGFALENENGALSDVSTTATTPNQRVRSYSGSYKRVDTTLTGDYQITNKDSATLNYTYETNNFTLRERDQTNEHQLKLTLTSKELPGGTLRVSGEYDHKTGSQWNQYGIGLLTQCPDLSQLVACFPAPTGAAFTLGSLDVNPTGNKYDIGDRDQYVMIGRFNYMITSTLDGMVTAREQIQEFPDPLGRSTRRDQSVSLEFNWQPTTTTNLYVWDTWQTMNQTQYSLDNNTGSCTAAEYDAGDCSWTYISTPTLGNVVGLTTNFFGYDTTDNNNVFGVGFSHLFDNKMKFDASIQYTGSQTSVNYADYCTGPTTNPLTGAAIGSGCGGGLTPGAAVIGNVVPFNGVNYPAAFSMPETWNQTTVKLGLLVPTSKNMAVSFNYSFDRANEYDFHYAGLAANNDVEGTRYYLSPDPGIGFSDQTFMISFHYKM